MACRSTAIVFAVSLALAALARAEPADHASEPDASTCDRARFGVVLDVGHTAESPGALGARNVWEYEFNLRLASLIEQSLVAAGFAETTLLITGGAARASLGARVAAANKLAPDLFLSIHHDAVPDSFLENWHYDGQPAHFSDRFHGHSLFVSTENPDFKASLAFAHLLGRQLKDRALQYTPHYTRAFMGRNRHELLDAEVGVYRYDLLVVLRSTAMPAVLLEAGSIVNRDEEREMAGAERPALTSAAVVDAVAQFCAARAHPRIARTAAVTQAADKPSGAEAAKPSRSKSVWSSVLKLFKQ